MKILIIGNSSIVFAKELKNELIDSSKEVYLLDFESLELFDSKNKLISQYNKNFTRYKKIPKFSMFIRMYIIRNILKEYKFDIVNIHYSRWFYLLILRTLSKSKLVVTFYGSDFYRSSDKVKKIQKKIYEKADAITFTNPITRESFLKYYNDYEEKTFVCRFGLKTLDFIDKSRDKDKFEIKNHLGYAVDKIIVSCGYNSTKAQQHEKIIQSIEQLDTSYRDRCQFIFPLTYGDENQKNIIKTRLKNVDFQYMILEDFLYEDDNAYIKLVSDIMINILQTDSFSGSMQEFLYADNIVITGDWLPYDLFDKEGIVYHKIQDINELSSKLSYVIDNLNDNVEINKKIIYKLSSWKNNISSWNNVYKSIMKDNYEN